ncbi:MAG: Asp-tRNA(Asn)/Glu-tRNA(Gln) amidotransferase subunit GatC [Sedimentisphaerales bacterium]|nr:Asp-tRNA(Asn)/Glu-tRNA(Gln) amidotransferase subunit GatC [Sedimentisphaerales bacterium]
MAGTIDQAMVTKVAKLARLELTDDEIQLFTTQLSAILDYMAKINELDTEDVEPLAHCLPISNVFREDIAKESFGTERALLNAPRQDGDFFKVPKILEDISS